MIIHNIIFKLGALEVFTKKNLEMGTETTDLPGVYWVDYTVHSAPLGPFGSVYQATEHYAIAVKNRNMDRALDALPAPPLRAVQILDGDLIEIDFVNKKRIC